MTAIFKGSDTLVGIEIYREHLMSIHLERVRLFVTTGEKVNSDIALDLKICFYVDCHCLTTFPIKGWNKKRLTHPWEGRTEIYEIEFQERGGITKNLGGTPVPFGIAFDDFVHVRTASFWLRMKRDKTLKIEHYYLLGNFVEMLQVPGTIDSFQSLHHGWLLMARRGDDVDMSLDPQGNAIWHHIELNGTF